MCFLLKISWYNSFWSNPSQTEIWLQIEIEICFWSSKTMLNILICPFLQPMTQNQYSLHLTYYSFWSCHIIILTLLKNSKLNPPKQGGNWILLGSQIILSTNGNSKEFMKLDITFLVPTQCSKKSLILEDKTTRTEHYCRNSINLSSFPLPNTNLNCYLL